jgi:hypothetical protein
MSKCALLYLTIGITITTASYAFFNEFIQMPGQMFQMGTQTMNQMVQSPQPVSYTCKCEDNKK